MMAVMVMEILIGTILKQLLFLKAKNVFIKLLVNLKMVLIITY